MGGHDHHEIKIPDYRIYKVEDIPLLVQTKNALASRGLHDPWLRNEVWRYNPKVFGTEKTRLKMLLRGSKLGLAATVLTVLGTTLYDKMNPSDHESHDH